MFSTAFDGFHFVGDPIFRPDFGIFEREIQRLRNSARSEHIKGLTGVSVKSRDFARDICLTAKLVDALEQGFAIGHPIEGDAFEDGIGRRHFQRFIASKSRP